MTGVPSGAMMLIAYLDAIGRDIERSEELLCGYQMDIS